MGNAKSNKLERLVVECFEKPDRSGKAPQSFDVQFNPDSYTHAYKNPFRGRAGINTSGIRDAYSFSAPEEVRFTIVLDGKVIWDKAEAGKKTDVDVYSLVQDFLDKAHYSHGSIHAPWYLRLIWGDMRFNCRLLEAEVKYLDFKRTGKPDRAEINTVFIGEVDDPTKARVNNSPDLTHSRVVQAGDTLPMMTERIYGSKDYYIEVARANQLDDIRNLSPGRTLFFPPLKK